MRIRTPFGIHFPSYDPSSSFFVPTHLCPLPLMLYRALVTFHSLFM